MAKTELHLQPPAQPSTPKKAKPAVSEPDLIAGPEVIGREISVFQGSVKNPEWWDGRVVEFNSEAAQHLVRYHREHRSEQWLHLDGQPFQWKGSPPPTAAPNPSVKGIRLNDSLLGRKVKVFWPAMSKWYLGCIKEYDPHASKHTIKYKDGEIKIHALRNEAVWWLDTSDAKSNPSSPKSRSHSTSTRNASPDVRGPAKRHSRSSGRTSGGSSGRHGRQQQNTTADTLHHQPATDVQAAAASEPKPEGSTGTDAKGAAGAEGCSAAERDCHSGVFAAASGNADTDAENEYASQHSRRQDAAGESPSARQDEEEQMQDHDPQGASNPQAKPSRVATLRQGRARDWTRLAADTKGRRSGTPRNGDARGPLDEPGAGDALAGARVGIFWEDDETFYKGYLAGFDAYHKRSKVCYDDGQEEWISLAKERFRWFTPRGCTSKHFNPQMKGVMQQLGALDLATGPNPLHLPSNPTQTLVPYSGVPSSAAQSDSASTQQPAVATAGSTAEPQAFAAVGWGLSIFSYAEEVWVKGQVLSWNVRQGQHHVLYEDGEDEWLKLGKEHVQWHSHKCDIAQRAGLQNGRRVPEGLAAVGWRVGVYWRDDQKFYMGEIAAYNEEDDEYEMNYDDNEKEDICLQEQPMKWLLPPGLSTTGEAPEAHPRRPRRTTSNVEPARVRRQPSSRHPGQERGLDKQRSRLGPSRRSTGIQKVTAAPFKPAPLSLLSHSAAPAATSLQQAGGPNPSAATAAPATATAAPTAVAVAEPASSSMPMAVAPRVPSSARLGPSSLPHIDRVIALGSRRAPHLAGTRVKIYCSQGGRGIKSLRSTSTAVGADSSRRVRQKVEALDLMIWRCECARKVITKGAPIPASAPLGQDTAQPHCLASTVPVPGLIASQVAAHLADTQALPMTSSPAQELAEGSIFGENHAQPATQIPASSTQQPAGSKQPYAVDHVQNGLHHEDSSDHVVLINQLPTSAPSLSQEDSALLPQSSVPASQGRQQATDQLSSEACQQDGRQPPPAAGQGSPRAHSRSPSSSPPANPSSPGSASLAGLIPATTAVTVPPQHQPPYSIISAARAASQGDGAVPVVTSHDPQTTMTAAALPNASEGAVVSDHRQEGLIYRPVGTVMESLQPELLSKLPVLKGVLRAQSSIRLPATPGSETAEHHAALSRERSSFSKSASLLAGAPGDLDVGPMQKGVASTSGLLELAMSNALPAGDLEPDMFAAFFEDSDGFGDKSGPANA